MKLTKYIFLIFIIPIYCQFGKNIVQYKKVSTGTTFSLNILMYIFIMMI